MKTKYISEIWQPHTYTHRKSYIRLELCGLIVLNLAVTHRNVTSLLGAGKTQPENLFAVVVSNSFQTLPGRLVEQLCNLHIC